MPITDYTLPIDKTMAWGEIATLDDAQIWAFRQAVAQIYVFGFGYARAADGTIRPPNAKTDLLEGICRNADIYEKRPGYSLTTQGYEGIPAREVVPLIRGGKAGAPISVPISSAVTGGGQVFWQVIDSTTNTAGLAGTFRGDSDGVAPNDRAIVVPFARWYRSAVAPAANTLGTGYLELRMPN